MKCRIEDCQREVHQKLLCGRHYYRLWRNGDPLKISRNAPGSSLSEKFHSFGWDVAKDGCWNWRGRLNENGYGSIKHEGKRIYAHRASYMLNTGPIESGKVICHSCDNPKCVNPSHLWAGTQNENIRDMISKGRQRAGRRWSEAEVLGFVSDWRSGKYPTMKSMEIEFGMSGGTMTRIMKGQIWSTVTGINPID